MWDHVHESPTLGQPSTLPPLRRAKKNLVSEYETFFQERGKRASLFGCDLSDIRKVFQSGAKWSREAEFPLSDLEAARSPPQGVSGTQRANQLLLFRNGGGETQQSPGGCFWTLSTDIGSNEELTAARWRPHSRDTTPQRHQGE